MQRRTEGSRAPHRDRTLDEDGSDGGESPAVQRRPAVLVVDDDVSIRVLLRFFLEDERWSVLEASNGVDALDLIRSRPDVSVVITDVGMPGMSGWELATAIKAYRADMPIMFMSGFLEESIDPQFRDNVFLEKPFTKGEMKEIVASLLSARD
jgi:CheY-like chemotaxis protein